LESAGIEFIDENGGGPGVRLRKREGGIIYKCLPGHHDDLGISCAMVNWAAHHPHLDWWMGNMLAARRPRPQRQKFGWGAFTVTEAR
jgi:hypothetical protein